MLLQCHMDLVSPYDALSWVPQFDNDFLTFSAGSIVFQHWNKWEILPETLYNYDRS